MLQLISVWQEKDTSVHSWDPEQPCRSQIQQGNSKMRSLFWVKDNAEKESINQTVCPLWVQLGGIWEQTVQDRFTIANICFSVKTEEHQISPTYCLQILKQIRECSPLERLTWELQQKALMRWFWEGERVGGQSKEKDLCISDKTDVSPVNLHLFISSAT